MGRRWRALAALAAALAGFSSASGVARADFSRVAVVIERRANLSEREADALASRLAEALRVQLEVDVIAGTDARRRLPPRGIARDCAAQPDCLQDLARRLDGDELLLLSMVRAGPRVKIDVTWCDPDIGLVTDRGALVLPALAGPEADRVLASAPSRLLPHASPRGGLLDGVASGPLAASPPPPTGRRFTAPVLVTAAVAVAALGAGTGFSVAARADYQALEDDGCAREACPAARRRVDQMERRALAADILFGTAVVAAVSSAILYFTSGEPESRLSVAAAPGSDGAVVSFGWAF